MPRTVAMLLEALARLNSRHPWSHNDAFAAWVLRTARSVGGGPAGRRALDVGCGTGYLAEKLADACAAVVAIEPDEAAAAHARRRLAGSRNVEIREVPFEALGDEAFDVITFVASLHHMPLAPTLARVKAMLRPGGRLVVVGLTREAPGDLPLAVMSMLLNPLIGLLRHPRRATAAPLDMTAPTAEPRETFDEIASVMRQTLPGVVIRRRLFWRYTAVWAAPST